MFRGEPRNAGAVLGRRLAKRRHDNWTPYARPSEHGATAHTRSGVPGLLNSNNLTVQLAPWFLAAVLRASSQSLRNCTIPLSVSGW